MSSGERAEQLLKLDLFEVLGLPRTASAEDVKKGYLTAVKQFHPDRAPSDAVRPAYMKAFARIELAKATLMDPTRRARYADELTRGASGSGATDRSIAEAAFEFAKAEAYLKTNDRARAEQHVKRALALQPEKVEYAVLLVAVRTTDDASPARLQELATDLDQIVSRSPDSERALYQRGQLRKRLGRTSEAMTDFQKVVDLNAGHIEAARELRLHKRRAQEIAPAPADGIAGVFRRLFKR